MKEIIVGPSGSGKTTLLKDTIQRALGGQNILICAPRRIHCEHLAPRSDSVFHFTNNTHGEILRLSRCVDLVIIDDACNISIKLWDKLADIIRAVPFFAIAGTPCVVNYTWDEKKGWESDCYFKNMIDTMAGNFAKIANLRTTRGPDYIKMAKAEMSENDFRTQILGEWVCNYNV